MQWKQLLHRPGEPRPYEPMPLTGEDGHISIMLYKNGHTSYELATMRSNGKQKVVLLQDTHRHGENKWPSVLVYHYVELPEYEAELGDIDPGTALGLRIRFLWTLAKLQRASYAALKAADFRQLEPQVQEPRVQFTPQQLDTLKATVDAAQLYGFPDQVRSISVTNVDDGDDTITVTFNYEDTFNYEEDNNE